MTEKELLLKIGQLRSIKPEKNWVCFTKSQILGHDKPKFVFLPYFKPALASVVACLFVFGFIGFTANSAPGDTLYSVKRLAKKTQVFFISDANKPVFELECANRTLEGIVAVPAKNLAPSLTEFQASISEATKNLGKIDAATSTSDSVRKIAEQTAKLDQNKQVAESLGVVIGDEETEILYKASAEYLIEYLEGRSLSDEKEEILSQIRELFEEEKYLEVLELYLTSQF